MRSRRSDGALVARLAGIHLMLMVAVAVLTLPGSATAQFDFSVSWQYSGTVSVDAGPQPYECLNDIGGGNLRCTGWNCLTQEDCTAKAPGTICAVGLIPPPDAATITKLATAGIADGDPFVGCIHFDENVPDAVPDLDFFSSSIGVYAATGTNLWFGANPGPGHNHPGYVGDFVDQAENFPNSRESDQAIYAWNDCIPLICGTNTFPYDWAQAANGGRDLPELAPACPGGATGLCSSDQTPCNTTCAIAVCDLPADPNDPDAPCVNAATDCAPGGSCIISNCWNDFQCARGICTSGLVPVDPNDPNAVKCQDGDIDCDALPWQVCDLPLDPNNPKAPCVDPSTDCAPGAECIAGKENCTGGEGCSQNDCPNAGDTCNGHLTCAAGCADPWCSEEEEARVNRPSWLLGKALDVRTGSSDTAVMTSDDLPPPPYDYWPFTYPNIAEGDSARCLNYAKGTLVFEDTDTNVEYVVALDLDLVERIVDADRDCIEDASDNCLGVYNPMQLDRGGLNTTTPNGIGDACECGDVTNNGQVQINDATIIKRAILGLGPGIAAPGKCNVIGGADATVVDAGLGLTADCLINDATIVKRAILGLGPGIGSSCGEPEMRVVLAP